MTAPAFSKMGTGGGCRNDGSRKAFFDLVGLLLKKQPDLVKDLEQICGMSNFAPDEL